MALQAMLQGESAVLQMVQVKKECLPKAFSCWSTTSFGKPHLDMVNRKIPNNDIQHSQLMLALSTDA